jgi:PAS domain S-box-containing protein
MHLPTSINFQQFFESAPGVQAVVTADLTIVAVSDLYVIAGHIPREKLLGRNIFEAFPDNPGNENIGLKALRDSFNHVLQHKESHRIEPVRYDVETAPGEFEEKYWSTINTPIFDADGNVQSILHQVQDVTTEIALKKAAEQRAFEHERELEKINAELEEQVRNKTEQLTNIFERITDGFIALDKDFNYTYLNKRIGELLNLDPVSLIGQNVWKVFPDAVGSPTYKAFMQAMETQQPVINIDYYPPLDLWQENHIFPSKDGLSIFIRDISERMRSEEKLRMSEQKYRFLFENNPLPMWMLRMPDRKFLAVNNAAIRNYGYSKEEFLSMTAMDIRPKEDISLFTEQMKEMQPGIYNAGIWRHLKKDGSMIQVEIIAHDSFYDGLPARLILASDITERLKAEEALRQSEEINRLIMSSSLNAIVCMDKYGKIIFWNPQAEKIFGWEKEETIGRMMDDTLIPRSLRENFLKELQHYRETGKSPLLKRLIESTAMNKYGEELPVEWAIIPVKDNGNEFFCVFIQDIRERKEAEEQLKQSHEQLRQLASHLQNVREEEQKRIAREVHDELGQQVTGLKMDVAWIWKKIAGLQGSNPIEEKLKEMTSLLDSAVKTIRKIASELRPAILDDMGLIPALEWQTKEFHKRFSIPVEFKSSVRHLEPDGDGTIATGLFRLYQESLTNIARHSGATSVYAELDADAKNVFLTITDNGKGFNIEETKNRKTLGLLGMKERALMMNGELTFISTPGQGTTVKIVVPMQRKELSKQNYY